MQQQYFNPATGKPVYFDPKTGQQVEEPSQGVTPPVQTVAPPQGSGRGSGAGPTGQRERIGGRAGYQSNASDEPIVEPNPFEKMDKFMSTPLTTAPSRWGKAASEFIDPNDPLKGRSTGGLRGMSSAFLESLGNVGTEMTTPESLAITALTAGEGMAAKQGSKFLPLLTGARRIASAPSVGHGVVDLAEGNTTQGLANLVLGGAGVALPAPGGGGGKPTIDLTPPTGGRVVNEARVLKSIETLENAKSPSAAARAAEFLMEDMKGADPQTVAKVSERANALIEATKKRYPEQFRARTESRKSMGEFVEGIKQADEVSRQFGTERAEDTLGAIARPGEEVTPPVERRAPTRTGPSLTDEEFLTSVKELAGEGTPEEIYNKIKNLPQVPPEVKQRLKTIMGAGAEEVTPAATVPNPQLPQGLRGAKPRYQDYDLHFTSDLEKALYIVAQTKASARNADYLRFIQEHTGLGPVEAKALGQTIKQRIQERIAKGGDEIDLTGLLTPEDLPPQQGAVPPVVEAPPQGPPTGAPPTGGIPPTGPPAGGPPAGGGAPPTPPPNRPAPIPTPPPNLPITTSMGRSTPAVENAYQKVSGVIRSVLTSYDLSALRQGKGLITHPEYWTNIKSLFQSWGSQKGLDSIHQAIVQDPSGYFTPSLARNASGRSQRVVPSLAEAAGLDLTPGSVNERWGSKFAANIPGVAASQRAFEGYILKLRADVFKKLYGEAEGLGRGNPVVAKEIANIVNRATGAGGLGGFEKSRVGMKVLNEMFFAPRYNASRVQMYTQVLNPKLYTSMDPITRREALRSLFGVVGTGLLLGELGKFAGAEVSNDPTSSDFRKMRFGDTRIDNFAGLQQYGVATARLLSGESTSSTSGRTFDLTNPKFGGQNRLDVMENFIESKAAPIPSFIMGWMRGKEFDGQPFQAKLALAQRIAPIVTQDLYALYQENPALIPAFLIPIIFGEGVQTYGR